MEMEQVTGIKSEIQKANGDLAKMRECHAVVMDLIEAANIMLAGYDELITARNELDKAAHWLNERILFYETKNEETQNP